MDCREISKRFGQNEANATDISFSFFYFQTPASQNRIIAGGVALSKKATNSAPVGPVRTNANTLSTTPPAPSNRVNAASANIGIMEA